MEICSKNARRGEGDEGVRRHWAYLKYLLRHKWFVLLSTWKTGSTLWAGLRHDLSKFRPSEWIPSARTFYTLNGDKRYVSTLEYDRAWLLHQRRNPHHWEFWILVDNAACAALEMPQHYVREMVADWMGAGRAITGRWEVGEWYEKNKRTMLLHANTRKLVEDILEELGRDAG